MSIHLSLAKGLRSEVSKEIQERHRAAILRIKPKLAKRKTAPITEKGARILHRELGAVYNNASLIAFDGLFYGQYGYWVVWDIKRPRGNTDWSEDLLSVTGMMLNLFAPRQSPIFLKSAFGISMHLIERVFQRLDTMEHHAVLAELQQAALIGAALADGLCLCLADSAKVSVPLLLPTPNGIIVGDACESHGDTMLVFRTFIGGAGEISRSKQRLASELASWAIRFDPLIGPGLELLAEDSLDPAYRTDPEVQKIHAMAREYLDILEANSGALVAFEERTQRLTERDAMWNSALRQK